MPTLHITRQHTLGLDKARAIAQQWAVDAESDFGMDIFLEKAAGKAIAASASSNGAPQTVDRWNFKRTGVHGSLVSNAQSFELELHLGFLLGAFQDKIKQEIEKNLDQLLGPAKG
jgi:putative polyhydroxyalkanoate system protein